MTDQNNFFQGEAIAPDDHEGRRRVAGYLVHPPIAMQRVRYRPETGQVIYYGRQCGDAEASPARIFTALDFLAGLCLHVPDSGQQLIRYYGAWSYVRRAQLMITRSEKEDRPRCLRLGTMPGGGQRRFQSRITAPEGELTGAMSSPPQHTVPLPCGLPGRAAEEERSVL